MTTLVTGAGGFLGQNLMRRLGDDLVGIDNDSRATDQNFLYGDIIVYEEIDDLIWKHKPDIVYHLAAINGTANFYTKA